MAYSGGSQGVGTAPVNLFVPGEEGALVSNLGTAPVTLAGPGVVVGAGVVLAANSGPVFVPGHNVVGDASADEALHAVQPGTAGGSIAWTNLI
jgi:hypothetical protein